MNSEIVIRVPQTPLPRSLIESGEYRGLPQSAREAFLAHLRYMQEIPLKLQEWLANGAAVEELEDLVHRVDLDISINLRVPGANEEISPWIIRRSWATSGRPIAGFVDVRRHAVLNRALPGIAAPLKEVRAWVGDVSDGFNGLLDDFFSSKTFDHAVANLIAIYALAAAIKAGLARVGLSRPS